jgi:hypothetical protein
MGHTTPTVGYFLQTPLTRSLSPQPRRTFCIFLRLLTYVTVSNCEVMDWEGNGQLPGRSRVVFKESYCHDWTGLFLA